MPGHLGSEPFASLSWQDKGAERVVPASLELWGTVEASSDKDHPPGRLIQGESARVMSALLPEYNQRLDLIYLDPPFLSGNAYRARIGRDEDSRRPEKWQTVRSYQDEWEDGAQYLEMLHTRLQLMYTLLAPTGTLYLHLDWHASPYARVMLDEIFGPDRLLNEIVWVYHGPSPIKSAFNRKHDTILAYTKSKEYTFNADDVRVPYNQSTIKTFASSEKAGFGKKPDLKRGKVPEDWWYFPVVARLHNERTGYPTQKPEALLERIIRASSNPGDVVADFFAGSGTTASVATRLGREWLACDPSELAFATTYRRLLLNEKHAEFELWRDESMASEPQLDLECGIEHRQEGMELTLASARAITGPELDFPEEVSFWEADVGFNGDPFQSSRQEIRKWRDPELNTSMMFADDAAASRIKVRAFDNRGRYGILEVSSGRS